MFARTGAAHGQRPVDQAVIDLLHALQLAGVFRVAEQNDMEVSIAYVANHRAINLVRFEIAAGVLDTFGKARNRHADIRGKGFSLAGQQVLGGPEGIVPGLPKTQAVFLLGRPVKGPAAMAGGNFAKPFRLLFRRGRGAVELHEQCGLHRKGQFRIGVDRLDVLGIDKLDPRHRYAHLDGFDGGAAAGFDRGESAHARRNRFRNAMELELHLGDDAKGAFRTDHQPGEIISGGRLAGPRSGADHFAIWHHHREAEYIVFHRAKAHRIGARGAGGRHAAEARVCARINREEQALITQRGIEGLARYTRFNAAIEIFGINFQNAIHTAEINGNSAERRGEMPLQRGARAKGNDRNLMGRAYRHNGAHLARVPDEGNRIRRGPFVPGLVLAVLLPHRWRG